MLIYEYIFIACKYEIINIVGAGMCDLSLPQFVWEMPGYDYHGLYTFVPDLVDIPII